MRLHYEDINSRGRPAILMLHGLGATGASWGQHAERLGLEGYRILLPDLRGFGRSDFPGHTSIRAMAQDMASLLDARGACPAHVVGISMGGAVALQLTIDRPHLVRGLVLVNTFAHLEPGSLRSRLYFLSRLIMVHTLGLAPQARLVARHMFPAPEQEALRQALYKQIVQAHPAGYRAVMRALSRFDARRRLRDICSPTLVLTGQKDRTVSPGNQRTLVERIPGARQIMVANAGHALPEDQPDMFFRNVKEFLEGVEAAMHNRATQP